jgi:hypothetical protein
MPWFRVDDGFWGHPKRLQLSYSAIGLWTVAGSWVARNLTDGHVPRAVLRTLGGSKRDVNALINAGLWVDTPGGWQFKDWDHYQKTKAQVERDRALARERMGKARNGYREVEQPPDVTQSVRANIDGTNASSSTSHTKPSQAKPTQSIPSNNYLEGEAPTPNCSKHPNGTDDPCGGCGDAKRRLTRWNEQRAEAKAHEAKARKAAIAACGLCDDNGLTHGDQPTRCTHQRKGDPA